MIQVENLSFGFGDKELYKKISFTLEEGKHCAFIGSNGTGKTTLVELLLHPEEYVYEGKLLLEEGSRIGYVNQSFVEEEHKEQTVFSFLSEVFVQLQQKMEAICARMAGEEDLDAVFEEYQKILDLSLALDADHYESNIKKQLALVGMTEKENTELGTLSGGEYKLLQVMREMLKLPNLLIMDEPDVFLDFEHMNGLCELINSYKGTLLVITHNRYLLNHCFDKILHLEDGEIQEFDGDYITYNYMLLQKKIELQEQVLEEQKEIERAQQMVNRMRTQATNVSIASLGRAVHAKQTYLDRLRARAIKAPFLEQRIPHIEFPEVEADSQEVILQVTDYSVKFEKTVLEHVNFQLKANEKVAIVGANGTGKTTLFYDIYKNQNPSVKIAEGAKVGFLSQFYEKVWDEKLSGGEQNLRQIEQIAKGDANLLLLDEPTSHLDTYAQIGLEQALAEYKGAVLMVSHDFYTIVNCVDSILFVDETSVRPMRVRTFRKMIYANHFDKDYLELEQKKKTLEMNIQERLKANDVKMAKQLCEQLGEIVEKRLR